MAFTIENNQPSAGCIRWTSLNMQYKGTNYTIANGYTNYAYSYWTPATPNNLVVSNTFPTLGVDDCLVFLNKAGTAITVPNSTVLQGDLIVPGSIVANALAANTITGDKIAAGAITATNIAAGTISSDKIAANAIGASLIAANAITADKIIAGAITADKIAAATITANKIAANTITAASGIIADAAITTAKIASIDAAKITTGTINAARINANSLIVGSSTLGTKCGEWDNAEGNAKGYMECITKLSTINNQTDTLFHFDDNLCSTDGINPNGGYVAALRKGKGRFGGAVAVDEGTTNLLTGAALNFVGWSAYGGTVVTLTQGQSIPGLTTNGATRIQTSGGAGADVGLKYYTGFGTGTAGTPFSTSVWIYNIGTKTVHMTGNELQGWVDVNPGEVKYCSLSKASVSGTGDRQLRFQASVATDSLDFIAFQPQGEQKSFATSFVNGARSTGTLWYDKSVLPLNKFTISGWFNPLQIHQTSTGKTGINGNWYFPLIELAPTTNRGTGGYGFGLAIEPSTGANFRKMRLMSPVSATGTALIQDDTWHHIAVTFDGSCYKVYVNGVEDISFVSTTVSQVFADTVFMVGGNYCGKPNSLIDELFISSKVLSAYEIEAICNMQQPFYDANPSVSVPIPLVSKISFI